MHNVSLLAGIAFDPGIRGILVVMVGVSVLMGSTYLLLGTNLGNRLGLLVALAGLFGWLTILTFIWWLTPPAIGPRGSLPSWKPVEVYVNGSGETPKTAKLSLLMDPSLLPKANLYVAQHPELATEFPNGFTLSDLQTAHPSWVAENLTSDQLNGWRLIGAANAGEAQAAADTALADLKIFTASSEYKKLNVFEFGGKPTLAQDCPDGGTACRVWHRISSAFQIKNPPHFAVVQVQRVIPQPTIPGQAPPIPKIDPSQPVISVVLIRNIGDERVIPFLYFVICSTLFILFAWILHSRDKTLMRNKELADAAEKGN